MEVAQAGAAVVAVRPLPDPHLLDRRRRVHHPPGLHQGHQENRHPVLAQDLRAGLGMLLQLLQSVRLGGADRSHSSTSSVRPSYGGGKYYGGGATTAYSAGTRSPLGITPYLIGGAALGIFPGLWLYGAYAYPYSHSYSFVNRTDTNSSNPNGVNETLPVTCLCQEYSACGCDDNGNTTYIDSLLGNGSAADMNSSLVTVSPVNGTKTVVINGTLPNGTTTTSAAGPGVKQTLLESSGFWVVGAIVGYTVWLM